jgi:DNA-binding NtrC family response regulator
MRRLFAVLERIAASSAPLLIEGETGTGKELCAEAVHLSSPRRARPFVVCDLAGVPRSLIESELFGHRKGAFTGATSDRPGALASADTGTLFLDELAELEIDLQPRLLRAIEAKAFKPIGGNDYTRVDVRFIAATNRDLAFEVRSGRFRGDLYHRLAVMHVRIPPLRERKEDIPDLCTQLLAGTGSVVAPRALDVLTAYDWPGNVRELRNVLERAVALAPPGRSVEPEALGLALTSTAAKDSAHYHAARRLLLDNWERAYVTQVIEMAGGNLSLAARRCGLGRAHLRRLLNKHDVR